MFPLDYEYRGPGYRSGYAEGFAEGRTQGRIEGAAEAILIVLNSRGIAITDEQREQVLGCNDLEQLWVWLCRAATRADGREVFEA
jgi:hypothetical protein